MPRQGQAALEFMFFTAMLILLLVVSFIFSSATNADTANLRKKYEAENVCEEFAVFISAVATSGNGTIVEYTLPSYIGGSNYYVRVNSSSASITVEYLTGAQTCRVSTSNFTSTIVTNKTGHIKNFGGGVFIE